MRFPMTLTRRMTGYILKNKLTGKEKFPLVLMLEPLHACNLTCTGCGRIREYKSTINEMLSVEECVGAAEECGAPVISICGGEPLIYPEIGRLTKELLDRKRHIYLCTNGMFIRKKLHEFQPSSSFFFNVHLDGMEKTHDMCVERDGVFQEAIEGIKAAKAAGFLVSSNTTIYKETDLEEIAELYDFLTGLGVDGFMLSPAYSYSAVQTKDMFMSRDEIQEKFRLACALLERYNLMMSPIYLDYLRGERDLMCTAWANPTFNPKGWKGPCYLMTDSHSESYQEFLDKTPWDKYGYGRDPRCEDCMVHVGYEPSAVLGGNSKLGDGWRLLKWQVVPGTRKPLRTPTIHPSGGNGNGNGAGPSAPAGEGSRKDADREVLPILQ
jgi:hopanoid biosynthesis associated radical SAM protein HpnH